MNMETVGKLIARTGDALGCPPNGSGLNSIRRNGIVNISKGCDDKGRGQTDAVKAAEHRHGTRTIEHNYDDGTQTTDNGAIMMGRPLQRIEGLVSMAASRLPALAEVRCFSDISRTDPVYVRLFAEAPERVKRRAGLATAKASHASIAARLVPAMKATDHSSAAAARKLSVQCDRAKHTVRERTKVLARLEARLRHATLVTKRAELWEDHISNFDCVTKEEQRERMRFDDVSAVTWEMLIARYSVPNVRRALRETKAAAPTARGKRTCAGASGRVSRSTAVESKARPRRGKLVRARVTVARDGLKLAIKVTPDRRGVCKRRSCVVVPAVSDEEAAHAEATASVPRRTRCGRLAPRRLFGVES